MDLPLVRSLGDSCGYEELFFNASDGVVVFESRLSSNRSTRPERTAISVVVWYNNKSVSLILPHPRHGWVQSFFFDVGMSELREILCDSDKKCPSGYSMSSCDWTPQHVESEENAIRRQLTLIDIEEASIAKERGLLESRLRELPPLVKRSTTGGVSLSALERRKLELTSEIELLERQKTQNENELRNLMAHKGGLNDDAANASQSIVSGNKAPYQTSYSVGGTTDDSVSLGRKARSAGENGGQRFRYSDDERVDATDGSRFTAQKSSFFPRAPIKRDSPTRFKGNRCLYCFANEEYHDEFGKAWSLKAVSSVALSRGYIVVYDDGGVAWWDISYELDKKFRNADVRLPPVQFAALGPDGNYFVKFVNGKMEWVAKDSFQQAICYGVTERQLCVNRVALGANGSWVILWKDGSVDFEGVPTDLAALLNSQNNEGPGVRDVSLGPHDEWFTIFKDHSVQANNLPDTLHTALAKIKDDGGRVRSVAFGEMSSWYVRFWDGS